jgi:hypothetical protein
MKKRLFITGIPTAGKSYLAKKLANEVGGICVSVDDIREDLADDGRYKKWVNFYLDKNEFEYYSKSTPAELWNDLVAQCEGLWPAVLSKIAEYENEERPVIFEGVNILPHLASRDLRIPGVAILGKTLEETFERNKKDPRWGATVELQKMEAENFFNCERPHYKEEAERYGYPVFESADDAWETSVKILKLD